MDDCLPNYLTPKHVVVKVVSGLEVLKSSTVELDNLYICPTLCNKMNTPLKIDIHTISLQLFYSLRNINVVNLSLNIFQSTYVYRSQSQPQLLIITKDLQVYSLIFQNDSTISLKSWAMYISRKQYSKRSKMCICVDESTFVALISIYSSKRSMWTG